jgi:hypothetical protein
MQIAIYDSEGNMFESSPDLVSTFDFIIEDPESTTVDTTCADALPEVRTNDIPEQLVSFDTDANPN